MEKVLENLSGPMISSLETTLHKFLFNGAKRFFFSPLQEIAEYLYGSCQTSLTVFHKRRWPELSKSSPKRLVKKELDGLDWLGR